LIEHQEGKANFKANLSGKNKGPGKAKGVFYNPAMQFSRDLNVEFAKKINFQGLFLDGMAASGVRGIRLALECGFNVEFCDSSYLAVQQIEENLTMNNLSSKVFHDDINNIVKTKSYDWIDLDPFGTPVPFLSAAIENINDRGILGVAATDTAVLCGAKPSICFKRYGSYTMKKVAAKEVGIRILLAHIQKLAESFDRSIEPLLCYSEGHHLRIFVRIIARKDIALKWLNYNMELFDEMDSEFAGPLWVDRIIVPSLIPNNCQGLLGKFFETLKSEAEGPVGLFDINDIARDADIGQTPKKVKIIDCLKKGGFFASSSIFSPLGIKTNAPLNMRIKAIKLAQSL